MVIKSEQYGSPLLSSQQSGWYKDVPYSGLLDNRGLPKGSQIPDLVGGNQPPTLSRQKELANTRYRPTTPKPATGPKISALGLDGYTPVSNFDLAPGGTGFDGTYTGINQNSVKSAASATGNAAPQLLISPTGQYTQSSLKDSASTKKTVKTTKGLGSVVDSSNGRSYQGIKKPQPKYADSDYLSELRALDRELAAYKAKMGLNRTRAGTQYKISDRDLGQQKDRDLKDLKDDFAARGIVLSGVYGGKVGEYNKIWGQQSSDLSRQYKDSLTDIQNSYNDYLREVGTQKEQAKLAAIRRRAQKLGKL